jgi:hypothetical protein
MLTEENKGGVGGVSIGIDGQRKATVAWTAWSAYPLGTTEVAAQTGGGVMIARWFYLMNGDRCDNVWWPGGRRHLIGGPRRGVSQ